MANSLGSKENKKESGGFRRKKNRPLKNFRLGKGKGVENWHLKETCGARVIYLVKLIVANKICDSAST